MRSAWGRQSRERTILRFLVVGFFVLTGAGLRPAAALATPLFPDKSTTQPTGLAIGFGTAGNCSVGSGTLQSDDTTTATVTITGGGPCTVTASQPGNSQFNPAVSVPQTFNVKPTTTTTTTADIAGPYSDPETFTASVTPTALAGQTLTGTVQFAVDTVNVGSPVTIDSAGHASLPATFSQNAGKHAITAIFASTNNAFANSSGTASLMVGQEDTKLIYSGAVSGDYHDPVTLKAQLLEDGNVATPLAGKSISIHLGTQSCSATTDTSGVASCALTPIQDPGSVSTVSASFVGDANEATSTASTAFTLLKEASAITYSAPMQAIVGSPSTLTAVLTEDGKTPAAGKTVTINLGSGQTVQSCSTVTKAAGTATCTLPAKKQLAGYTSVSASFAGDADYQPASDVSQHVLLFAIPANGAFVIGDSTARTALGTNQSVTWWGPRWWKQNSLSGSGAPTGFFGFTHNLSNSLPTCGTTWTSSVGNSLGPPKNIPSYMGVLVTSRISKSGNTFNGNTTSLAVVKTDPAHLGNGTMLQLFCPASPHPLTVARPFRAFASPALPHSHAILHLASQFYGFGPMKQTHRTIHTTNYQCSRMRPNRQNGVIHITRHLRTARHPVPFSQTPKQDQTITFGALDDHTFGDAPFTISAESVTTITGPVLPPDPSTVAPPVDTSVASGLLATTQFLHTGNNPIQTGVAAGTITQRQVSVLRGTVLTRDGKPLPGVIVTALNHPEFGQTLSRADGGYDVAVNGGGQIVLNYQLTGYISAQRQVYAPWQDYARVDSVALVPYDPNVTLVSFSASGSTIQVAQGSSQTDSDGTRQQTLLFQPGTTATMTLANGTTQTLSAGHVRATEFTIGPNGPTAMPAQLPSTIAYTYAFDFSIDEAVAAGATGAGFSRPVIAYNQNFLGVKAGTPVPLGYYDPMQGHWVGDDNGLVVTILSIQGGEASLDVAGSGTPASASQYAALGITESERQQLAMLYSAGTSLWRVPLAHFGSGINGSARTLTRQLVPQNPGAQPPSSSGPIDLNYGPPVTSPSPGNCSNSAKLVRSLLRTLHPADSGGLCKVPLSSPNLDDTLDNPAADPGFGDLQIQNQTFGETVPVSGTPYSLHYNSGRVSGFGDTLRIPVSGPSVDPITTEIQLHIRVAGREFDQTFPPQPNQVFTFRWDGLDAYGRKLQGKQPITIEIRDVFAGDYTFPVDPNRAFARPGGVLVISRVLGHFVGTRTPGVAIQIIKAQIGAWDQRPDGLGGWSLNIHHSYDPVGQTLFLGDGTKRSAQGLQPIIDRVAGGGSGCPQQTDTLGDGCLATQGALGDQTGMIAFGPDGSMYTLGTRQGSRVRKISPNGIISTLFCCFTQAPTGLALGPDGNVYVTDGYESSVYKIDPSGQRTLVAGGANGFGGDGGPATQALLNYPAGVAVAPDGSVYINDAANDRIRRVGTDGIITTFASQGGAGCSQQTDSIGDGCPVGQANIGGGLVDVGIDGAVYIQDGPNNLIRRVGPSGIVTTVAGNGTGSLPADGQPATSGGFGNPGINNMAVDRQGDIYFSMQNYPSGCFVREVTPTGIERTVAGPSGCTVGGDSGPATAAGFSNGVAGVAVGPDDSLYISDRFNGEIRRVGSPLPGVGAAAFDFLIPSADGSQIYHFNPDGRHLDTRNALTGAVLYQFGYDTAGRLTSVTNRNGDVTRIDHDTSGNPTHIVGPFGQTTTLSMTADGFLASVTDPLGHSKHMGYGTGGLLTSITGACGNTYTVGYDADGRLIQATDPTGALTTLTVTTTPTGKQVVLTSPLGRHTTYATNYLPSGVLEQTITFPDGTSSRSDLATDQSATVTTSAGIVIHSVPGPDPRFGMQAPQLNSGVITTPHGLSHTVGESRVVSLSDPSNSQSLTSSTRTLNVNGNTFSGTYTPSSHSFAVSTPAGRQLSLVVDAQNRPTRIQSGNLVPFSKIYDSHGRPTTITQGSGAGVRTSTYSYGSDGLLATATDPVGRSAAYTYDAAGNMLTQTIPGGGVVQYTHDANGNLTSLTTPGGHPYQFTLDSLDRTSSVMPPDVGTGSTATTVTYNTDRQLTDITRPDGQNIGLSYDATSGKLSSMSLPRGTISYSYQASTGNLASITAPGNIGLAYTDDGSLVTGKNWTGPVTGSVSHTYNNDLQVASQSVDGGPSIAYSYDTDGLPTQVGDLAITRDASNGFTSGTTLGNCTTSPTYSSFSELSRTSASCNGASLISDSYTRDALGRIITKTEAITLSGTTTTHTYAYQYDAQSGRLTQVQKDGTTTESYRYDADGNRLTVPGVSTPATYNAQSELTQYGGTAYTYNAGGDLATKIDGSGTTTYSYDPTGSLLGVTKPGAPTISYLIDGEGQRIGKQINGTLTQGFLYDNEGRIVAVLDGSNALVSTLVYSGHDTTPSYMITGGVEYRIISDSVGSPRLVVNSSTGQIMEQLDYNAFGQVSMPVVAPGWNPTSMPIGFAGGLTDPDTGLVRIGARDYDPQTGRWTTRDPLGFRAGEYNLYSYAFGDPINVIDPTGAGPFDDAQNGAVPTDPGVDFGSSGGAPTQPIDSGGGASGGASEGIPAPGAPGGGDTEGSNTPVGHASPPDHGGNGTLVGNSGTGNTDSTTPVGIAVRSQPHSSDTGQPISFSNSANQTLQFDPTALGLIQGGVNSSPGAAVGRATLNTNDFAVGRATLQPILSSGGP